MTHWIKFEVTTSDKPEVWAIADALGIDPDAVVGKLLRLWAWFDEHTETGNATANAKVTLAALPNRYRSVTKSLLDRKVGVSGFCDACILAGWMIEDESGISLPNFERHNGNTAKTRALTAKRVGEHKKKGNATANATANAKVTLGALPRIEESREEKKENNDAAHQSYPAEFEQFWKAYPVNSKGRKVGKKASLALWSKVPAADRGLLVEAAAAYGREQTEFVRDPERFLKADYWRDFTTPAEKPARKSRVATAEDLANWSPYGDYE